MKPGGKGRKGRQKLRQRLYEEKNSCTQENLQPFTEVWHKNEPLILTQVKDIPKDKTSKEFFRDQLAIVSFDIAISHEER